MNIEYWDPKLSETEKERSRNLEKNEIKRLDNKLKELNKKDLLINKDKLTLFRIAVLNGEEYEGVEEKIQAEKNKIINVDLKKKILPIKDPDHLEDEININLEKMTNETKLMDKRIKELNERLINLTTIN